MNKPVIAAAAALLLATAFTAHAGDANMKPGDKMAQQKQAQAEQREAEQKAREEAAAHGNDGGHPQEEAKAEEAADEGENPN